MARRARKKRTRGGGAARLNRKSKGLLGNLAREFRSLTGGRPGRQTIRNERAATLQRKFRRVFGTFRKSLKGLMQARLTHERERKAKEIKVIKAMLHGIDAALSKPRSREAVRRLKAIKQQLARDMRRAMIELAQRLDSGKRLLTKLRSGSRVPLKSSKRD